VTTSPGLRCGPMPEQIAKSGTEAAHQTALFAWAALNTYKYPELAWMFAIPNGGTRNPIEAGFMKAAGVRSGVPDVFFPVARWGKHGLWIELKVGKNKPRKHQTEWIAMLMHLGYAVVVAYSWIEASDYIIQYLEDDHENHTAGGS
jgi:VRR-NUC domain